LNGLLALLLLAARPDALTVGVLAEPVTLAPHQATDFASAAVISTVCETLVRFRPNSTRPEGGLATTWATTDGRDWTFTLREGIRFQDGAPLDADAVVENLNDLAKVRGFPGKAARVGPYVVGINLERPSTALLATLSQPFYSIQSPRQIGQAAALPVGTGPFRLNSAKPGMIELTANPGYWGGAPRLKSLVFKRLPSQEALLGELLSGAIDVTSALDRSGVSLAKEHSDIAIETQKGLNIGFLSLNNERAPFSDRRVRQALARALDAEALVEQLLGGRGEPVHTPLPPSLWAFAPLQKWAHLDRAAAKKLLTQSGFSDGFETTLMSVDSPRPYMPDPPALGEHVVADLLQVGVRAKIERVATWAEYASKGSRGEYDMAIFGWQVDTIDPNDFLSVLLGSESIGATNRSRYRSPQMDSLLKKGRRETDPSARMAIYREVQSLFQQDMPFIPLFSVSVFTAYARSVHGLELGPTGLLRYDHVWKGN
jgi:peptide/nickel transport system substrate-binding protein